jgi:anti-sigma-K factor RskA
VIGLIAWNVLLTRQLSQRQQAPQQVARYSLTASGAMSGASGTVVVLPGQDVMFVSFRSLPAPPPGKVDELWLGNPSGQMSAAGVFSPDADGAKVLMLSKDVRSYSVIAVTVERGPNGTSAPTQAPQMVGNLRA